MILSGPALRHGSLKSLFSDSLIFAFLTPYLPNQALPQAAASAPSSPITVVPRSSQGYLAHKTPSFLQRAGTDPSMSSSFNFAKAKVKHLPPKDHHRSLGIGLQ